MRTGSDSAVSVPRSARPEGPTDWLAGARLSGWLRSHTKGPRTSWKDFGLFAAAGGLAAAGLLAVAGFSAVAAALAIASVGLGLGWGITWLIVRQTLCRPIDRIATSMETLAARDVLALVDEFANLADGEPPGQIEVHARQVALPSDPSARRLAEALNTTIARLQGGAHQFHAASQDI
jgi:hypothetical protein